MMSDNSATFLAQDFPDPLQRLALCRLLRGKPSLKQSLQNDRLPTDYSRIRDCNMRVISNVRHACAGGPSWPRRHPVRGTLRYALYRVAKLPSGYQLHRAG